jgi:hypothetical protein
MISRVEEQLKVQNAYRENNEKKYIVNVTHIELKYALLSETDSISTGRYVPVWEVTYTSLWEGATLSNTWKIYFNAVDGSYVEPRITNTELMSFTNESNQIRKVPANNERVAPSQCDAAYKDIIIINQNENNLN